MKIARLIGILSLLLQHEQLTANQLSEHFEVSARTIYRDIVPGGYSAGYGAGPGRRRGDYERL